MSKRNSILEKRFIPFNTIIEVRDESKEFIPYWNLSTKEHLSNNFITLESNPNNSKVISLNDFNFKLIDSKELPELMQKEDIIQLDKLFTIDVYRIRKEKDLNADFIKSMKDNYNINNVNVVLYNIEDVKENSIKNLGKLLDKLKSKIGLINFSLIPYNEQHYAKFYTVIDTFFASLKAKVIIEYNNKSKFLLEKINSFKDIYESTEQDMIYDYMKNKILYIDLMSIGELWEEIKKICTIDFFKSFTQLKNKYIFTDFTCDINIMEFKQKVKNKNITNVEYQLYLINCYMQSCIYSKDYNGLILFLLDIINKLNTYKDQFDSEYHFFFWIINYIINLVNYLKDFDDKMSPIDIDNKSIIKKGIIFLYTICIKYLKQYAKIFKYEIPSNKIFIEIKTWVDKGLNINEELSKIFGDNNFEVTQDKTEIFNKFKNDIKSFDNSYPELNKNLNDVFINKKIFLEEYLNILQIISKRSCEIYKLNNTIENFFEIIPILIVLNKFEEAKNILITLLKEKTFIKNKLSTLYQFICLLLIMLLHFSEKNDDNLKLMFKLLDTNFSNQKYFLSKFECKEENLINDIISKFIEKYSDIEYSSDIKDKNNKTFSLDKTINILLEEKQDNIIFINKQKTNKLEIKYNITNNTGINLNINKIQLIFEEFNENKKLNIDSSKEKEEIIYEINQETNTLKNIKPFIKEQENIFIIELNENDKFKLNKTYKFKRIQYIINNSLCGIYDIKQELKICFNSIEMRISTQVFPSYDSSEYSPSSKKVFYFNTLAKINIDLIDLPNKEILKNKKLKINFEDLDKNVNTKLIIQTLLLKEELIKIFPDIIINDYSIEFLFDNLKEEKDKLNLVIPFYVENINFYDNGMVSMKITVEIINQNDINDNNNNKENIYYSFSSFHEISLIHLFNIRKKFRMLNDDAILMQTTFSLNIETTNLIVYTNNSDKFSFYMDTTQAINLVLLLPKKDEKKIINKLRQNFLHFSLDDIINNEKKKIKYRICYPEKDILNEIKELKEIPYYINITLDEINNDIYKEINVNINIKKNNKKKVLLLIHICDNENWAIIGKSKLIEEWFNDNDNKEKNFKIKLLPLLDGFLKLPEIEFMEYEISENKDDVLKINENENINNDEFAIGKMDFDPIEYGTIIEGNEKVVNITPAKECTLKLNLT